MSDILIRIQRAVLAGRYVFSEKARWELDVAESMLNAVAVCKRIRSASARRWSAGEYFYVTQGTTLDGLARTPDAVRAELDRIPSVAAKASIERAREAGWLQSRSIHNV